MMTQILFILKIQISYCGGHGPLRSGLKILFDLGIKLSKASEKRHFRLAPLNLVHFNGFGIAHFFVLFKIRI